MKSLILLFLSVGVGTILGCIGAKIMCEALGINDSFILMCIIEGLFLSISFARIAFLWRKM